MRLEKYPAVIEPFIHQMDGDAGLLTPLWIADMDFRVCPEITKALHDRISHPIYGYSRPGDTYWSSITGWLRKRHDFEVRREEKREVFATAEHKVAVDFVRHHKHTVFTGQASYLGQSLAAPLNPGGIVGVAENHHLRMLVGKNPLKLREIHYRLVAQAP